MKTILFALLLALAVALPLPAAINAVDPVPAATLLLPYFEVDLADPNGMQTSFNVVNVDSTARLAHVTLWTDRGVPTYAFDLGLDAYGMVEVDLRQLFVHGVPPQTESAITGCAASLPPARLDATVIEALQQAHTGQASALLGGNCGGAAHGDASARGYITIDVTVACTTTFPTDATYFNSIASLDNVLWGDYSIAQRALGTMHADALVSIEADELAEETDGANDYTFYGHRVAATGADHRENLPGEWWARFVAGAGQSTEAIIWRDPGAAASFPCAAPPAGLGLTTIVPFDDQEQPDIVGTPSQVPLATQRIDVVAAFDITPEAGFVLYDLRTNDPDFGVARQAFVSHVHRSASSAGQMAGWSLRGQNLSSQVSFPPCSDGVDNDGDGFIDGDDPGCVGSRGWSENPECGDGVDNDGDTLIDGADPECYSPYDPIEAFSGPCNDGIDNDGDGFIDFPEDPQCFAFGDQHEGFNFCSDGIDNDGDGLIDYPADPGCSSIFDSDEGGACDNGIDDDGDGLIDDADPGCGGSRTGFTESPACNNGLDDDGDGAIDLADGGCESAGDNNESNPCNDGIDNDGDGDIDFPDDAGCRDADWTSEYSACSDGADNDGDGLIDHPDDPGCESPWSDIEAPMCDNGADDDGDGLIDAADPSCSSPFDNTEWGDCGDGVDNDGDGLIDYPFETGCDSTSDGNEGPDCSDGIDNDGDGFIDAADDGCSSPTDLNEFASSTQRGCSDGIDNDGDGLVDYPNDPGCLSAYDHVEINQ